jgi:hypothetical protein
MLCNDTCLMRREGAEIVANSNIFTPRSPRLRVTIVRLSAAGSECHDDLFSRACDEHAGEFQALANRMLELARVMPGFISANPSSRRTASAAASSSSTRWHLRARAKP